MSWVALHVRFEAAIDASFGDLPQRELANCDKDPAAKELHESLDFFGAIHIIPALHPVLPRSESVGPSQFRWRYAGPQIRHSLAHDIRGLIALPVPILSMCYIQGLDDMILAASIPDIFVPLSALASVGMLCGASSSTRTPSDGRPRFASTNPFVLEKSCLCLRFSFLERLPVGTKVLAMALRPCVFDDPNHDVFAVARAGVRASLSNRLLGLCRHRTRRVTEDNLNSPSLLGMGSEDLQPIFGFLSFGFLRKGWFFFLLYPRNCGLRLE